MPGIKQLKSFLVNHPGWTQGNNLQENEIEVSLVGNRLTAEFICRNGLGSVWSCKKTLDIVCPECFKHLFSKKQMLVLYL